MFSSNLPFYVPSLGMLASRRRQKPAASSGGDSTTDPMLSTLSYTSKEHLRITAVPGSQGQLILCQFVGPTRQGGTYYFMVGQNLLNKKNEAVYREYKCFGSANSATPCPCRVIERVRDGLFSAPSPAHTHPPQPYTLPQPSIPPTAAARRPLPAASTSFSNSTAVRSLPPHRGLVSSPPFLHPESSSKEPTEGSTTSTTSSTSSSTDTASGSPNSHDHGTHTHPPPPPQTAASSRSAPKPTSVVPDQSLLPRARSSPSSSLTSDSDASSLGPRSSSVPVAKTSGGYPIPAPTAPLPYSRAPRGVVRPLPAPVPAQTRRRPLPTSSTPGTAGIPRPLPKPTALPRRPPSNVIPKPPPPTQKTTTSVSVPPGTGVAIPQHASNRTVFGAVRQAPSLLTPAQASFMQFQRQMFLQQKLQQQKLQQQKQQQQQRQQQRARSQSAAPSSSSSSSLVASPHQSDGSVADSTGKRVVEAKKTTVAPATKAPSRGGVAAPFVMNPVFAQMMFRYQVSHARAQAAAAAAAAARANGAPNVSVNGGGAPSQVAANMAPATAATVTPQQRQQLASAISNLSMNPALLNFSYPQFMTAVGRAGAVPTTSTTAPTAPGRASSPAGSDGSVSSTTAAATRTALPSFAHQIAALGMWQQMHPSQMAAAAAAAAASQGKGGVAPKMPATVAVKGAVVPGGKRPVPTGLLPLPVPYGTAATSLPTALQEGSTTRMKTRSRSLKESSGPESKAIPAPPAPAVPAPATGHRGRGRAPARGRGRGRSRRGGRGGRGGRTPKRRRRRKDDDDEFKLEDDSDYIDPEFRSIRAPPSGVPASAVSLPSLPQLIPGGGVTAQGMVPGVGFSSGYPQSHPPIPPRSSNAPTPTSRRGRSSSSSVLQKYATSVFAPPAEINVVEMRVNDKPFLFLKQDSIQFKHRKYKNIRGQGGAVLYKEHCCTYRRQTRCNVLVVQRLSDGQCFVRGTHICHAMYADPPQGTVVQPKRRRRKRRATKTSTTTTAAPTPPLAGFPPPNATSKKITTLAPTPVAPAAAPASASTKPPARRRRRRSTAQKPKVAQVIDEEIEQESTPRRRRRPPSPIRITTRAQRRAAASGKPTTLAIGSLPPPPPPPPTPPHAKQSKTPSSKKAVPAPPVAPVPQQRIILHGCYPPVASKESILTLFVSMPNDTPASSRSSRTPPLSHWRVKFGSDTEVANGRRGLRPVVSVQRRRDLTKTLTRFPDAQYVVSVFVPSELEKSLMGCGDGDGDDVMDEDLPLDRDVELSVSLTRSAGLLWTSNGVSFRYRRFYDLMASLPPSDRVTRSASRKRKRAQGTGAADDSTPFDAVDASRPTKKRKVETAQSTTPTSFHPWPDANPPSLSELLGQPFLGFHVLGNSHLVRDRRAVIYGVNPPACFVSGLTRVQVFFSLYSFVVVQGFVCPMPVRSDDLQIKSVRFGDSKVTRGITVKRVRLPEGSEGTPPPAPNLIDPRPLDCLDLRISNQNEWSRLQNANYVLTCLVPRGKRSGSVDVAIEVDGIPFEGHLRNGFTYVTPTHNEGSPRGVIVEEERAEEGMAGDGRGDGDEESFSAFRLFGSDGDGLQPLFPFGGQF